MTKSHSLLRIEAMRASKPITVTLGELQERVEARVKSGEFASASEVVRAGLRALDREEEALNEYLREKIREAYDDPRPSIPAEEVFERLERKHAERIKVLGKNA
jgi:antitoxin ParD1/3/4